MGSVTPQKTCIRAKTVSMSSYAHLHLQSTRHIPAFDSLSVIISVTSTEALPGRGVDSVLAQLRATDQLILVDECETSEATIEMARAADDDHRILVVHKSGAGYGAARNAGLEFVASNYVVYLDDGAELVEGALEDIRAAIRSSRNPDMIFGGQGRPYPGQHAGVEVPLWFPSSPSDRLRAFLLDDAYPVLRSLVVFRKAALGFAPFPPALGVDADVPVVASMLYKGECVALPGALALHPSFSGPVGGVARRSPGNRYELVDEVFSRLPESAQELKPAYLVHECLAGYVQATKGRWYSDARGFFVSALRLAPRKALSWQYIKRLPQLLLWKKA